MSQRSLLDPDRSAEVEAVVALAARLKVRLVRTETGLEAWPRDRVTDDLRAAVAACREDLRERLRRVAMPFPIYAARIGRGIAQMPEPIRDDYFRIRIKLTREGWPYEESELFAFHCAHEGLEP